MNSKSRKLGFREDQAPGDLDFMESRLPGLGFYEIQASGVLDFTESSLSEAAGSRKIQKRRRCFFGCAEHF